MFSGIFALFWDFCTFMFSLFSDFIVGGIQGFLRAITDGASDFFSILNPINWFTSGGCGMFGDLFDALASKFGQWLPNGNFAVPFELVTVYNAVTDIWEALPLLVRAAFVGAFGIMTLFCILRMLFGREVCSVETAGAVGGGLVVLLLNRLFSWLPGSLGLCVWAVIAAFFFIIVVKLINFIFGFIFSFINMLKPGGILNLHFQKRGI